MNVSLAIELCIMSRLIHPTSKSFPMALNLDWLHSITCWMNSISCFVYVEDRKITWLLNASKYVRKCQRGLQHNKLWFSSSKCSKSSFFSSSKCSKSYFHLFQNHLPTYFKIIFIISNSKSPSSPSVSTLEIALDFGDKIFNL